MNKKLLAVLLTLAAAAAVVGVIALSLLVPDVLFLLVLVGLGAWGLSIIYRAALAFLEDRDQRESDYVRKVKYDE